MFSNHNKRFSQNIGNGAIKGRTTKDPMQIIEVHKLDSRVQTEVELE